MKAHFSAFSIIAVLAASTAPAQEITPIWEYLATGDSPLPILRAQQLPSGADADDGSSLYDELGGFKRYDDSRLLLSIFENGIDESDPAHDAALAAEFPDRSLIWINPNDGSPMGVALVVGFEPVPLDQDFLARGGSSLDAYMNFGAADDGVLFVGYKNKVLRYVPNGDGFDGPFVAYTHPDDGTDTWPQWRWENFRVTGAGADTVVLAGCKTWRTNQGYFALTTDDGESFSPGGFIPPGFGNAGGGGSHIIVREGEELVYVSSYPGSSNGTDTTFYRFFRPESSGEDFAKDTDLFNAEVPDNPISEYRARFISDVDGLTGLDFVVTYSTPSWNTLTLGLEDFAPGFLALHDHEGFYISSHTLDIVEESEMFSDGVIAPGRSLFGNVSLYIPEGAGENSAELLWYSATYGYGRYAIGDIPADVREWAVY